MPKMQLDETIELPMEERPIRVSRDVETFLLATLRALTPKQRPAAKRAIIAVYQCGKQMEHGQWITMYRERIEEAVDVLKAEKVIA
jgi:hypothetical protein